MGTTRDDKPHHFLTAEGIRSYAITSLEASGMPVGCMLVGYRAASGFDKEQQRVLSLLSASAAIAIRSRRLNDQVERQLIHRQNDAMALIERAILSGADKHQIFELVLRR